MSGTNKNNKRKASPAREWVSDNLRYIILIAVIAAAAAAVFFVVRTITGGGDNENTQVVSQSGSDAQPDEAQTPGPGGGADVLSDQEGSGQSPDAASNDGAVQNTDTDQQIISVVNTYLAALANGDADTAASVMETLSDEDAQLISEKSFAESYSNIQTYIYDGNEEGTYVAFAVYDYKDPSAEAVQKGLTQLYLITAEDGSVKIASENDHPGAADYMTRLLARQDVKELITSVKGNNADQ